MDDELLNKIRKDLEKSGLGSELKACKIFEENGWRVTSGSSYYDKDEQKTREIDIIGYMSKSITKKSKEDEYALFSDSNILAEVKKSEKPWILFKKENRYKCILNWMEIVDINLHKTDRYFLSDLLEKTSKNFELEYKVSGIHEAFKSPNDNSRWYGACISVIKASIDKYECQKNELSKEFIKENRIFDIYYPLIILDGKMVGAKLNETNHIDLKYISEAMLDLSFGTKRYAESQYKIRIVTLDGLDSFLKKINNQHVDINTTIMKLEYIDPTLYEMES